MQHSVFFISARKGYAKEGLLAEGYDVINPYRDKTLIGRIIREIWFQCGFSEKIWYTRIKKSFKYIIVQDPLVTKTYLKWLVNSQPTSIIHFIYGNQIGRAKHVKPKDIPKEINTWTFDQNDSKKYGINLHSSGGYSKSYIGKKNHILFDVFYVGADKGRGEFICDLERKMRQLGLKTKFIITADKKIARKKRYYSRPIPYSKVIEYNNSSKAILNIVLPNQIGATMRDFESIFNSIKLITNNNNIKNYDFYRAENVFILGERNLSELIDFLKTPFKPIEQVNLEKYTISALVDEIISSRTN
ncbi:MAG: hypothetical protein PHY08_13770 [Candidatus Cloacimonetes bacterium]|nr:hypothetical protein [Candidatus Cloacimonadota bacterium]